MSFVFVPALDINATKNIDYVAYSDNNLCNVGNGILTPTTPSQNKILEHGRLIYASRKIRNFRSKIE